MSDVKLQPEVEVALRRLQTLQSNEPLTPEHVRESSVATTAMIAGEPEEVARTWQQTFDTGRGAVPVRWYVPFETRPDKLLVHIHGGGFVAGTLDTYDPFCRSLARRTRALVANIGYSLSPEAKHPQALDEVIGFLRQARSLADTADVPVSDWAVSGDSAGGCLAAAALSEMAKSGDTLPNAAVLIYPMLDATMNYQSYRKFGDGYQFTAVQARWYWSQYAGEKFDAGEPSISPMYAGRLARFPRTMMITAGFDLLRDEDEAFAERLKQAGVQVEQMDVPGAVHGFLRWRGVLHDPSWGPDAVMERIGQFLAR
ncbi:MAG TPA: alpha/beta hydrolase [Bryobacteraceae bacterium]|jgi:acetyl esterase|nr:alpha/beta hydrolase [Bryobacteraceae bacterium]